MSTDSTILRESYDATIRIIDDNFVYTQILNMVNSGDIADFKSACQGYFCAMYIRNVTLISFQKGMPMTYHPEHELYNDYFEKIAKNENIEKNVRNLK
jgi:hypothetical protein